MNFVDVNYLAVLACGVSAMILGSLWYGPIFGKLWMNLSGLTMKDMDQAKKAGMTWKYLVGLISSLVMAYVLAHFIYYTDAKTIKDGLTVAFWLWLGLIATISLGTVLWENKSFKLYLLNNAYNVVNLGIMSIILINWPA